MEKQKVADNPSNQQQIGYEKYLNRTNSSSSAVACGIPKWITRITGQQPNESRMSRSPSWNLAHSFSDPCLVGVGCTPPKSHVQ